MLLFEYWRSFGMGVYLEWTFIYNSALWRTLPWAFICFGLEVIENVDLRLLFYFLLSPVKRHELLCNLDFQNLS